MHEKVMLIKYDILKDVPHCFTTRRGGVSEGAVSSLNMSFTRESSHENVIENYRRVADSLGVCYAGMTRVQQKHTNKVIKITENMTGMGISNEFPDDIDISDGYDAMITNVPGVILCTVHADCVPVLLYDEENNAVAAIHSGWRGTALKISSETVKNMILEYGTDPSNIKAVIGPSISIERFETDADVYNEFKNSFCDSFEYLSKRYIYKQGLKYHIFVGGFVYETLLLSGLARENIFLDERCTYNNPDLFFSHRRDKGNTGAMSAMIGVRGGGV